MNERKRGSKPNKPKRQTTRKENRGTENRDTAQAGSTSQTGARGGNGKETDTAERKEQSKGKKQTQGKEQGRARGKSTGKDGASEAGERDRGTHGASKKTVRLRGFGFRV